MELLLGLVLLAVVAYFVVVPLRAGEDPATDHRDDPVLADLEARKQAKYREIRDTELDHAQGKLTERDFRIQEAELKREAIAILKAIDEARSERGLSEEPRPGADAGDGEGETEGNDDSVQ